MKGILNAISATAAITLAAVSAFAFFRGNIGWGYLAISLGGALVLSLLALWPLFRFSKHIEINAGFLTKLWR